MSTYLTAAQLTGLPFNNIISFWGDSRVANGVLIAGTNYNITSRSVIGWARNLCKQSFRCGTEHIHGTGGHTSAQILAALNAGIATDPAGTIVVLGSTNDRAAGLTDAETITNLTEIERLVISFGKLLIWANEMPRGGSNVLVAPQLQYHLSVVRWLSGRSVTPGVYVADTFSPLTLLTSASASPNTGMMGSDGLHPSTLGAYTAALAFKAIFDLIFRPSPSLAAGVVDIYDATYNRRGSLNLNPMLTGTAGTKNAGLGTISGNLADSYTADMLAATGLTAVLSKVTSGGKDWQQAVLSGTPTSASAGVRIASTTSISSLITAGDVIEQTVEVEWDASHTGLLSIQAEAVLSSMNRRDMSADTSWPTAANSMILKMGPWVADAFTTGFYKPNVTIYTEQNVLHSSTIRFRSLSVRKVV